MRALKNKLSALGSRNERLVSKYVFLMMPEIKATLSNGYTKKQVHKAIINKTGDRQITYQAVVKTIQRNIDRVSACTAMNTQTTINSFASDYHLNFKESTVEARIAQLQANKETI